MVKPDLPQLQKTAMLPVKPHWTEVILGIQPPALSCGAPTAIKRCAPDSATVEANSRPMGLWSEKSAGRPTVGVPMCQWLPESLLASTCVGMVHGCPWFA